MYSLREGHDQIEWDGFVGAQSWAQFEQSWDWGAFQESRGNIVRRFFLEERQTTVAAVQLIRYPRRFGLNYWFAPRGPIFSKEVLGRAASTVGNLRKVLIELLEHLLKQDWPGYSLFFRFEPLVSLADGKEITPLRFQRTHAMSPACTLLLDLKQTEDELLAQMHTKTRYNIRVAQKHGVTVREGGIADIESFLELTRETGERDEFTPQNLAYLKATYTYLVKTGGARLRLAEYEGRVLSANMEMKYGDTVTYLHGSSSSSSRQVMAPYLLQWEAIRKARQEGHAVYDWWGLNPELISNYYFKPTWAGITRFKLGWGGKRMTLMGTWDLPINRALYYAAFPKLLWRG
jgi:lipid II:glycine glycyltransferase (peptidoglycan interpeptide bridge formation enzyme)